MPRKALILVTALLLLTATGCKHKATNLLPSQLVGFWTSDDPSYKGRFLELFRAYVIIGTGERIPKVQAVDSVEAIVHPEYITYRITSTDLAGVHYKMALHYTPVHGGEIRFPHMGHMVWTRLPENNHPPSPPAKPTAPTPPPKKPKVAR